MRAYIMSAVAIGPHGDIDASGRRALGRDPLQADLSDILMELTGKEMRRAGHFTELAVIGSQLAIKRLCAPFEPSSPLYFATGLGEVQATTALFEQVMEGGAGSTSPYAFINSVSNTTAFHVAKTAGLTSTNITVSQEELSFESALRFAVSDVMDGYAEQSLVGGVDELSHPRSAHMKRLPLAEDELMGEGGGWLCIGRDPAGACGAVEGVVELALGIDDGDIDAWASAVAQAVMPWLETGCPVYLMPGLRLSGAHARALSMRLHGAKVRDYLGLCGRFHTAAAFGIAAIFDSMHETDTLYIHVSPNTEGRTMIVGIRAFARFRRD
ncbi:MAG: hypothetical protein HZB85_02420 [Deltaproteobacteria bacterium]|nr:hypothetical protein [Deltaproteobacteria bacterium]